MNNLSNERIEYYTQLPTQPDGEGRTVFMYEVRRMAHELLALRGAGKEPVASMHRLVNKRSSDAHPWTCSLGVRQSTEGDIFRVEVTPLYAAPQLPTVPDGWVIVPRKITLEMECALSRADSYEIGWQYAIAAAPKPE